MAFTLVFVAVALGGAGAAGGGALTTTAVAVTDGASGATRTAEAFALGLPSETLTGT
jgi:hypothetical protein